MPEKRKLGFTCATLFPCGTCNLRCRYCNIDKNPALATIDKMLEESFKDPAYYIGRFQKYIQPWELERIETWGGEPFLGMHRIYDLIEQLIPLYPNLSSMFSSTNFSFENWTDEFWGLIDVFAKFPYRHFQYDLQLSVDGPTELNDYNRGKNTTEKCLKNFNKLLDQLRADRLPKNVSLKIGIKPTLDNDGIRMLQTKEAIIDYYKFFEDNYLEPILPTDLTKSGQIEMTLPVPNTASPSPVTVEVGKLFANTVKLCREIEWENERDRDHKIFKFYSHITPYENAFRHIDKISYCEFCGHCGTGSTFIGFLPDDYISVCNEGFTELIGDYNALAATKEYELDTGSINFRRFVNPDKAFLCLTDEEFKKHQIKMNYFNNNNSTARNATIATEIICLAMAGQIEEGYLDPNVAAKTALVVGTHIAYCIKDNYNDTGSFTLIPLGILKLFLNGALKYLVNQNEEDILAYDFEQAARRQNELPI